MVCNPIKQNQKLTKGKSMKLALNLSFFLFGLFTFSNSSFSLTNYQIKKYCKKEKRESICVRSLLEKRSNLQKGKLIKIPVIPYRS